MHLTYILFLSLSFVNRWHKVFYKYYMNVFTFPLFFWKMHLLRR